MKTIELANGTVISVREGIDEGSMDLVHRATARQCDLAEKYAGNRYEWQDCIDPDGVSDFDETPEDERIALAIMIVVGNSRGDDSEEDEQ